MVTKTGEEEPPSMSQQSSIAFSFNGIQTTIKAFITANYYCCTSTTFTNLLFYPIISHLNQSEMANIGEQMANAVDAEIATFRTIQEEIQKLRTDQQLLMQQQSENEMVKQELDLIDDSDGGNSQVYKLVGPVLMKNELSDAKQTV